MYSFLGNTYLDHMNYDVFISYSRKDARVADKVCSALSESGISYFIDREGISAGVSFTEVIAKAIDESMVFLLLASDNAYKSKFTAAEVFYAFNHKKPGMIIPFILDEAPMPSQLELMLGPTHRLEMRSNPIETSLMMAIKHALNEENYHTEKKKSKKAFWPALVLIPLAAAGAFILFNRHQTATSEQARLNQASLDYGYYINIADSLTRLANKLKESPASSSNTDHQISCLLEARAAIRKAIVIKSMYSDDDHPEAFRAETAALSTVICDRLDSIYEAWSGFARESYELYRLTGLESEAQFVRESISHAVRIYSNDELIGLLDKLQEE